MAKKAALAITLVAFGVLRVFAQGDEGGLIEGNKWAFLVSAPTGWVWDARTLRIQGISGLFYKAGTEYSPSKLNIYISPTSKGPGEPVALSDFIQADEATFMKSNPGTIIKDIAPYSPGLDYRFILRDFDDQNENYYQSLAYYEGEDAFFIFVLSCRSPAEREDERASFLELLDSFVYIRKE
jgi:hypothetical protein